MIHVKIPPPLMDLFNAAGIGGRHNSYTDFVIGAIETYLPTAEDRFADRSKGRASDEGFEGFRVELQSALYSRVTRLSQERVEFKKQTRGKIHYSSKKSILEESIARRFANEWESLGLESAQHVSEATGLKAAVASNDGASLPVGPTDDKLAPGEGLSIDLVSDPKIEPKLARDTAPKEGEKTPNIAGRKRKID